MSDIENEGDATPEAQMGISDGATLSNAEDAKSKGPNTEVAQSPPAAQHDRAQVEPLAPSQPALSPESLVPGGVASPPVDQRPTGGEHNLIEPAQLPSQKDFDDLLPIDWHQKITGDPTGAALSEAFVSARQRTALAGFDAKPDGERLPFRATFSEEQLLRVDNLLLAIYPDTGKRPCLVRMIVFKDHLLIQANSAVALLQHCIYLDSPTGVGGKARTAFYIAASDLHQAVKACVGQGTLSWTEGGAITFASGLFERDLALRPAQQFHKLSAPIVAEMSEAPIGHVPIHELSNALRYGWPLVEGFNKKTFDTAVIESAGEGIFRLGQPGAMAVVTSQHEKDFVYSIGGKQATSLKAALTALEHPTELFHDKRHYILWDGSTAIGFDREGPMLQDAAKKWEAAEWGPQMLTSRNELIYAVRRVAALAGAELFELQVKGAGKITVTVSAASGPKKRARTAIEGASQAVIPITRLTFPVWPILAALQAEETVNACFRLSSFGLMIDDAGGKPFGRHYIMGQQARTAK